MLQIPYELKRRCAELSKTDTARHIYDTAFLAEHDGMGFETFRHKLRQWKKHTMAGDDTLNAGTYAGFTTLTKLCAKRGRVMARPKERRAEI